MCTLGATIMYATVKEYPIGKPIPPKPKLDLQEILSSVKHVTGSRLFWQIGIAHGLTFLVRSSERVLGVFFHDATFLPRKFLFLYNLASFVYYFCKVYAFLLFYAQKLRKGSSNLPI